FVNDRHGVVVARVAVVDAAARRERLTCAGVLGVVGLGEVGCVTAGQSAGGDRRRRGGAGRGIIRLGVCCRRYRDRPRRDVCGGAGGGRGEAVVTRGPPGYADATDADGLPRTYVLTREAPA